ncbi:MAG: outer membrane beta-barrel protein [Hyphomicrobiaceae bacterium]|nr:outer membrane beta-barrel protein [Hyphomicrobiaceae bacterium]
MNKMFKIAKTAIVAGVLAIGFTANPAQAGGDFGAPPAPPPAPVSGKTIWEGFHVGGHAGWGDFDYGVSQSGPASPLVGVRDSEDTFLGGFVFGSSWQFGKWVLGTDSAYKFGDAETGTNLAANGFGATVDVNYSAETRARAGILVQPNTLIYGTVGLASAEIEASGALVGGSNDKKVYGVVFGGGIETTTDSRWFARIEYLYADYEDESFAQVGGGSLDVDLDSSTVRGAIGYRFDWTPWELITGR